MDQSLLRVFLFEVQLQCRIALLAAQDFNAALERMRADTPRDNGEREQNTARVWYALQAFLTANANVSKLIWPDNRGDADRGRALQSVLSIADSSPLAPPRKLRNHFEHIDERLDKWARTSRRRNLLWRSFGMPGAIVGIDLSDYVAYYDLSNNEVTFLGEDPCPVQPLVTAIEEVLDKATAQLEHLLRPRWSPAPAPAQKPEPDADEQP